MSRLRASFLLLGLIYLLGACATAPGQRPSPSPVAAPVADGEASSPRREQGLPAVPLSPEILYELLVADIAVQRKRFDVAIENYLRLARRTGDPRMAARAARVAIYSRDNLSALEAARLWVRLDADDPEARQAIIAAYIRSGRTDDALQHIDALLEMQGDGENGLRLLVSLLSRERDVQAALKVMRHVIAVRGDNPEVWIAYGHLTLRSGDLGGAQEAIDKALELRPLWPEALLLKVRILQLRGEGGEALRLLADAVAARGGDMRLRAAYARLLTEEKQYEEALAQYRQLVKKHPDNSELKYTMGLLLLQLQRYDEAARELESIRRRGERFDDINFYLGWIAESRGDLQTAIDYYGAVTRGPNFLESGLRMAVLLARQDDIAGARQQLQSLRRKIPVHGQRIYLVEGEILRDAERYEEALDLFSEALEYFPDDHGLLYARALVAERLDRLDLLEQDLLRILEQNPDNADALNALGYTLADRTDRYEEAYRYIKRALELQPENNAILDSMGWVLYRMGQYEEAIRYLRLSLKLKMDDEVAAHLGEVLWVSGRHEEALRVWNEALEQFTGNKRLLEVIRRFSN